MRAIHGDLSILSPAHLVQALVQSRSAGLLTVECGLERRVLRVSPQGLRLVRGSQRCHRFERLLRGLRGAPSEDTPPPLLNPDASARVMGEWMLEEICDLLTWTSGTFAFHPFFDPSQEKEEGPFGAYAADVPVERVAIEAAHYADELPRIKKAIPDLRLVPVRAAAVATPRRRPKDEEVMEDILRLVDGRRPVIQLLRQSVFPRFSVLQVLYQLLRDGILRLESPAEHPVALAA
jgi:hypothetical protein